MEMLITKRGIYYWFGYPIQNTERFKLIKESGFDHVMLWWGDEFAEVDGDKMLLPSMGRRFGLDVENVHASYENINDIWLNNINSPDIVERYKQCILDCAAFNIPTVVIHITQGNNPPPFSQVGLDRIKRLIETAEKKQVNIAIENLRDINHLDAVLMNIKSERLGFCYDSGHENCYSKGAELLDKHGNRLMALHLHDNDGSEDQHRIPGEGTIDWTQVLAKLNSLNYTGSISFEVTKEFSRWYEDLSPREFLEVVNKKAIELLK